MHRRDFLKGMAASGAALALGGLEVAGVADNAWAGPSKVDIGQCKSVKITCVSETSWFDSAKMAQDIKNGGGAMVSHYDIPWSQDNIGGYSALIEVEHLD
jgi:7,8-dihydropterin-6-yl-methyl-4-(beta-D-ribofuranosyl)aminobenzene 5'-phosphate synthase